MTEEERGAQYANRLLIILTALMVFFVIFAESCNAQVLYATEYKWEKDAVKVFNANIRCFA